MIYIVMGVSGSGKTTIGRLIANDLGLPFYDADDFHPAENVAKMQSGQPLTDADRQPWLLALQAACRFWEPPGAVLACSALKESYRDTLRASGVPMCWVYLEGALDLIRERMAARDGHFMPTSLLESQFETLEAPKDAIRLSVDQRPEEILQTLIQKLAAQTHD